MLQNIFRPLFEVTINPNVDWKVSAKRWNKQVWTWFFFCLFAASFVFAAACWVWQCRRWVQKRIHVERHDTSCFWMDVECQPSIQVFKKKRNKILFYLFFSFKAIICITCMQTWLLWTNFVKHEASMCFICVLTVAKLVLQIIWLLRFCWPRISTTESRWERRQSSSICSICLKLVNSWKENFNSFPDVFLSCDKKRHFCFTNQQQQALSWVFTQPFSHLFQTRIECHFDHRWSSAVSFVRKKKFVFFALSEVFPRSESPLIEEWVTPQSPVLFILVYFLLSDTRLPCMCSSFQLTTFAKSLAIQSWSADLIIPSNWLG